MHSLLDAVRIANIMDELASRLAVEITPETETVFVGSGIFKSGNPAKRARAMVDAVLFHNDPLRLAEISRDLGEPMVGISVSSLSEKETLAGRGW